MTDILIMGEHNKNKEDPELEKVAHDYRLKQISIEEKAKKARLQSINDDLLKAGAQIDELSGNSVKSKSKSKDQHQKQQQKQHQQQHQPLTKAHVQPNNDHTPTTEPGNTYGLVLPVNSPNPNPPSNKPETKEEESFLGKASPWVHGGLGAVSFVPGLSIVSGFADTVIYLAEGDYVDAALSAVSMVPFGKWFTTAGKGVYKGYKLVKGIKELDSGVGLVRDIEGAESLTKGLEGAKRLEGAKGLEGVQELEGARGATQATEQSATQSGVSGASKSIAPPQAKAGFGGGFIKNVQALREKYLGRTPGKKSRTGKEVQARMLKEGNLRIDPITGLTEFKASDGIWYDVARADMSHKIDAVTWWNQTGRQYGAKAPEVRQWMLDPDNYVLDLNSLNRSAGAKLRQTYLPPLK